MELPSRLVTRARADKDALHRTLRTIVRHPRPLMRRPGRTRVASRPSRACHVSPPTLAPPLRPVRALRMIGHILDSQGSPVEHGRLFLSQLASAVVSFALRGERQPWGAEDTAFVFRERFKDAPHAQKAYDAILAYARKRPIVKS